MSIVSVTEAARITGLGTKAIYYRLNHGLLSKHFTFKNGKEVIGVNTSELTTNRCIVSDFDIESALDGEVRVVHMDGHEIIEMTRLESAIENDVVFVKETGEVGICNEDGFAGDEQVLFFSGTTVWVNVFRDSYGEYLVDDVKFADEDNAINKGKEEDHPDWRYITSFAVVEPEYLS